MTKDVTVGAKNRILDAGLLYFFPSRWMLLCFKTYSLGTAKARVSVTVPKFFGTSLRFSTQFLAHSVLLCCAA